MGWPGYITTSHLSLQFKQAAYSVLSVAYLIPPYLIIRFSFIIADESYCGVWINKNLHNHTILGVIRNNIEAKNQWSQYKSIKGKVSPP